MCEIENRMVVDSEWDYIDQERVTEHERKMRIIEAYQEAEGDIEYESL